MNLVIRRCAVDEAELITHSLVVSKIILKNGQGLAYKPISVYYLGI